MIKQLRSSSLRLRRGVIASGALSRKIRFVLLAALAGAALTAASCKDSTPNSASSKGSATPAGKTFTIGYSQCNRGEPWREQMDKDIERSALAHKEFKLLMKDAQNDPLQQQAHVRELVTQKVDVIIISPKDTSLTEAVGAAYDAGIPVIVLDRKVDGDRYTTFIGGDNRKIGAAVGAWIVEKLKGKGNVVELMGLGTSTPAAERSEPFRAAIANTGIKVIYSADMEWLADKAREKMQAALARNPEKGSIQLVYGANDPAALQAYYAAKDAGREKEMIFVGVDALPNEGVNAVKNHILDATFEYPNGAAEAIDAASKLVNHQLVPKTITLGTRLFTQDNVDKGGVPVQP